MKIELAKSENFWSLIDPENIESVVVILNENSRTVEINYDKLQNWAKEQIEASEKSSKIIVTEKPEVTVKKVTKSSTKKVESKE